MYRIELQQTRDYSVIDAREINTDDELFQFIGKWGAWYFFAIDRIDYEDARFHKAPSESRLLHFTANKANDEVGGPHRHGLHKGTLALGKAWGWFGEATPARIVVKDLDSPADIDLSVF